MRSCADDGENGRGIVGRLHQAQNAAIRAREIRLLSAQIRTGGRADDGGSGGGDVLMMEFFAGFACLAFVGCVCYVFYMVAEEQKGEWGE